MDKLLGPMRKPPPGSEEYMKIDAKRLHMESERITQLLMAKGQKSPDKKSDGNASKFSSASPKRRNKAQDGLTKPEESLAGYESPTVYSFRKEGGQTIKMKNGVKVTIPTRAEINEKLSHINH